MAGPLWLVSSRVAHASVAMVCSTGSSESGSLRSATGAGLDDPSSVNATSAAVDVEEWTRGTARGSMAEHSSESGMDPESEF